MMYARFGGLLFVACVAATPVDRPQYICVNNNQDWDPAKPESFTQATVDAVLTALNGTRGSSDGTRRLCLSFDFWVLYDSNETTMLASIDALLALALTNDLPLSLSIDATQWWQMRPDLYNWWDPAAPGYDPANTANVEWTGWTSSSATSLSWRNWGSQFRMPSPAPNIAAPAYRAAAAAAMAPVAARVGAWFAALPADRRYLLAYVRCTQELWIGTNYFVYPGANAPNGSANWPPARDPTSGVAGSAQVGFAAVCASSQGAAACAGPLTPDALDGVVGDFIRLAGGVLEAAGVPRSRRMAHTGSFFGGSPAPALAFNSPAAAVTAAAAPGWSLYAGETNASAAAGLDTALAAAGGAAWGAPEWLPFFSGGAVEAWAAAFAGTLGYRNNQLVVVQNWASIAGNANALAALAGALRTPPACLVQPPSALAAARVNATTWQLTWEPPAGAGGDASGVVVEAAASAQLLPSGRLAAPAVSQSLPPNATQLLLVQPDFDSEATPLRFWTVAAWGCGVLPDPRAQVAVADVLAL